MSWSTHHAPMAAACLKTKIDYEKHMMYQIQSVFCNLLRDAFHHPKTESELTLVYQHSLGLQTLIKQGWHQYYKYSQFYETFWQDMCFDDFWPVLDHWFENQEQLYVYDGFNEKRAPSWVSKAFYLHKLGEKMQNDDLQKYMVSKLKELDKKMNEKIDHICNHKS